ncbi:hypothetical protein E1B28_007129 [Marasmius oreades]|uniref:DNL-type domain-containing protein n=1 Tax=Marasmius oreades TaxID=181124 RepID=A0A9P7UUL5_9AGAR|nr:uncharacterized protein E1B28_007129 [Marasmius oreades]KAG7093451.1 hypothetical protein E1B28_007129 [Marasmius oreades]
MDPWNLDSVCYLCDDDTCTDTWLVIVTEENGYRSKCFDRGELGIVTAADTALFLPPMLPSRLYRNLGIPPPLRALITPHPSLPATVKVQLRLRLGIFNHRTISTSGIGRRDLSTSTCVQQHSSSSSESQSQSEPPSSSTIELGDGESPTSSNSADLTTSQVLPESIQPKLSMTFTCTVEGCGTRSTHEFSKRSYERGIVLVQCPGCENRHLIADHLGWFKESTEDGKLRTVEDLLRAKGEKVKRGKLNADGDIEYVE